MGKFYCIFIFLNYCETFGYSCEQEKQKEGFYCVKFQMTCAASHI